MCPSTDWISSETYELVDERRELKAHKRDSTTNAKHYNFLCREIRIGQRDIHKQYLSRSGSSSHAKKEQEGIRGNQENSAETTSTIQCSEGQARLQKSRQDGSCTIKSTALMMQSCRRYQMTSAVDWTLFQSQQ